MGLLKDQASRLMRESWNSPTELAEELYAMFTSEKPVVFDSPIQIDNPTGGPGIIINQGDVGDTTIQINNNPVWNPADVTTTIINQHITIIYGDGTIEGFPNPPPSPEQPQPGTGEQQGGGGGGFPAVIVSGDGVTYTIDAYINGTSATPLRVSARAIGLSTSADVPDGAQVQGFRVGGSYFIDVPRWL